jgi:chromosome segregation ATPase
MDQNYKHRAQLEKLIRRQEASDKAQEHQLKSLQSQLAHYPRRVILLKENIGSVNRETTKLRGELNSAKEEIQSRSQHSARVAGELKASSEERSRLEKDLRKLQDEHQKRKD